MRPPGASPGTIHVGAAANLVGSMFTFFFTDQPVVDWESAKRSDTARFGAFFRAMLGRGVYLAPSQFEAAFLSAAHSDGDMARTVAAAGEALQAAQYEIYARDTGVQPQVPVRPSFDRRSARKTLSED